MLGLAGLILLAVPALYAAHQAKAVSDFAEQKPGPGVHEKFRKGWRATLETITDRLHQWSRFHMICLYGGYGCLLMSYLVRFLG